MIEDEYRPDCSCGMTFMPYREWVDSRDDTEENQ